MITLRKLTQEDYEFFISQVNNPSNLCWMESDRPYHREDFIAILNTNIVKWFVIVNSDFRKKESENVGLFTSFIHQGRLNLGVIVDDKYRRKGYARKAFQFFLKESDRNKLDTYISCFADQPALPMYKELGYKELDEKKEIRGKEYIYLERKHL